MTKINVLDYAVSRGYKADRNGNIFGPTGTKLSLAKTGSGYLFFGVRKPIAAEGSFNVSAHRFVAYYFLGDIAKTSEVIRHLDDDKTNNKLSNLKPGTRSQNFNDNDENWKKEFALAGAATKRKLDENDVRSIRAMMDDQIPLARIATAYGVARTTIQQIKDGKSYAWVK